MAACDENTKKQLSRESIKFFEQFKMFVGGPEKIQAFFKRPVRRSVLMVIPADPEQHFPVMQNNAIGFPKVHIAIINMVGFGAAAIKFKYFEIDPFFEIFNG